MDEKTNCSHNVRTYVDIIEQNLFKMMTSYEADTGLKSLFEVFDHFFHESFSINGCYIFSVKGEGLSQAAKQTSYVRSLWKREDSTAYLLDEDVNKDLQDILMSRVSREEILERKKRIFIPFGHNEGQYIFAYFPFEQKIEQQTLAFLEIYLSQKIKMIARWREAHRLESLIYIDDVTGLFNQRKLVKDIQAAVKRFKDKAERFCVLFIDLDHFKSVNDEHGHLVGTQLLSDTAQVLLAQLRDSDLCYRYGGDEFVMLIPEATPEIALSIGKRVLKKITGHHFVVDENKLFNSSHLKAKQAKVHEFNLSVSVGVACFPDHAASEQEILSLADRMMYQAKQAGRGKVCFAGDMFKKEA